MLCEFQHLIKNIFVCYVSFKYSNSKPVSDIEPIDLSTRSFIITKCVGKIFLQSSIEIVNSEEIQTMLALDYLCKFLSIKLFIF